jgi:hypothetical protein
MKWTNILNERIIIYTTLEGINPFLGRRMASSGMLRRVALVRTDVSGNLVPQSSG